MHYAINTQSLIFVQQLVSFQGVFGFKGKSKRLNEDDFLINPKDKGQKARSDVYHEIWEDLYTQVEILRTDLNCQIFDDLLAFVSGQNKHSYFVTLLPFLMFLLLGEPMV